MSDNVWHVWQMHADPVREQHVDDTPLVQVAVKQHGKRPDDKAWIDPIVVTFSNHAAPLELPHVAKITVHEEGDLGDQLAELAAPHVGHDETSGHGHTHHQIIGWPSEPPPIVLEGRDEAGLREHVRALRELTKAAVADALARGGKLARERRIP